MQTGPLIQDILNQLQSIHDQYGIAQGQPTLYYRVIGFKEEEYAFLVIETDNTTAAKFIDEFDVNYLPPFEYEYIALSFNDHRGYVRGINNAYSKFAD